MQIAIISVPTLSNKENIVNGSLASALIVKAFKQAKFIPNNATNGDVIKALFPKIDDNFTNVIDLRLWWNAPYKAESGDKCKNCKYYRNPDYTRCHECKAESDDADAEERGL